MNKEQKKRKQKAERFLRLQGINYDDWLDDLHQKVIEENQDDILEQALKIMEQQNVVKDEKTTITETVHEHVQSENKFNS